MNKYSQLSPQALGDYYAKAALELLHDSNTAYVRQYLSQAIQHYRKAAKFDGQFKAHLEELESTWREINCLASHEEVITHLLNEVVCDDLS